jgi:hypothetical protein
MRATIASRKQHYVPLIEVIAGHGGGSSAGRENDRLPNRDVTGTRREGGLDRGF